MLLRCEHCWSSWSWCSLAHHCYLICCSDACAFCMCGGDRRRWDSMWRPSNWSGLLWSSRPACQWGVSLGQFSFVSAFRRGVNFWICPSLFAYHWFLEIHWRAFGTSNRWYPYSFTNDHISALTEARLPFLKRAFSRSLDLYKAFSAQHVVRVFLAPIIAARLKQMRVQGDYKT